MDEELIRAIKRWLPLREKINTKKSPALWLSNQHRRIEVQTVEKFWEKYARLVGLKGTTPHFGRYTFTFGITKGKARSPHPLGWG
jgi:site-specific recombinase XerD